MAGNKESRTERRIRSAFIDLLECVQKAEEEFMLLLQRQLQEFLRLKVF